MLVKHGYGVLLFDRRGEGASEGDRTSSAGAATATSRRCRVPPEAAGRRPATDRRDRLLGRRRDADPRRGALGRVQGDRLRRRERPVDRDDIENAGLVDGTCPAARSTPATALFTSTLPPPSLKSEIAKIAPTAAFFIYGEHGQGGTETKPNVPSTPPQASRSRSGRSRTASTSPGSRPSLRNTSAG